MYAKMNATITTKTGQKLCHYHHVQMDKEFKDDCRVWKNFLESPNNISLCHPYIDLQKFETSQMLNFFTDSSANPSMGFGCIFNNHLIFGQWEPGYIERYKPSIEYLELAVLCIGILSWSQYPA